MHSSDDYAVAALALTTTTVLLSALMYRYFLFLPTCYGMVM
jgi:hypothetical protein